MNIVQEKDRLILTNRSDALRSRSLATLAGIAVGALMLGIAFTRSATLGKIEYASLLVLGALSLIASVVVVAWGFPSSTVVIDRSARRVSIQESYASRSTEDGCSFDIIDRFGIVDVGTEYRQFEIQMFLKSGDTISISPSTDYKTEADAQNTLRLIESHFV